MYGMSTVWEGKNGCDKQYMGDLAIYLMTVLLYSYGMKMDCAINSPGNGNNIVHGINETDKRFLKGKMELIRKLSSNDTKRIGMLHSASKYVSIKFSDQCLHILNNKEKMDSTA